MSATLRKLRDRLLLSGCLTLLSLAATAGAALATNLSSPFEPIRPKLDKGAVVACDDPAPPVEVSLDVSSMYDQDDPSHSTVDDEQFADYSEGMAPVRDYVAALAKYSSDYVASIGAKADNALDGYQVYFKATFTDGSSGSTLPKAGDP